MNILNYEATETVQCKAQLAGHAGCMGKRWNTAVRGFGGS